MPQAVEGAREAFALFPCRVFRRIEERRLVAVRRLAEVRHPEPDEAHRSMRLCAVRPFGVEERYGRLAERGVVAGWPIVSVPKLSVVPALMIGRL